MSLGRLSAVGVGLSVGRDGYFVTDVFEPEVVAEVNRSQALQILRRLIEGEALQIKVGVSGGTCGRDSSQDARASF